MALQNMSVKEKRQFLALFCRSRCTECTRCVLNCGNDCSIDIFGASEDELDTAIKKINGEA